MNTTAKISGWRALVALYLLQTAFCLPAFAQYYSIDRLTIGGGCATWFHRLSKP